MKKPDKKPMKEEPKKRGRKSVADKLIAEVEEAYDFAKSRFEAHELDYYMDKEFHINGRLVDEDENITAEQVAILGGYSLVAQLRGRLNDIKEGKEPKISADMQVIEVKNGRQIPKVKLPKEIKRQIIEMLENMEDEDE